MILDARAVDEGASLPGGHSFYAVPASMAFLWNWLVSKVLEATTCRSTPVFASFYLRDLSYSLDNYHSLGPFVAAGSVLP